MSTSIPKSLPPGKDPPDKTIKSPTPSLNPPKSPQPTSSIPDQPSEPTTRPPFTPFFTLINSTHHPTQVHYIFSDDDPEILTSACLSALSPPSPNASASSPQAASTSSSSSSANPHRKRPSQNAPINNTAPLPREERTVILTLSSTGDTVVSAHSLTPTWQITSTEITNAPTWDAADTEETSHAGGRGLMLRIEGTDGRSSVDDNTTTIPQGSTSGKASGGDLGLDMQALMENFDAKMSMLRKVIEAGGSALNGQTPEEQAEMMPEEEEQKQSAE